MRIQRILFALLAAASLAACSSDDYATSPAPATAPVVLAAREDEDGPERTHGTYKIPFVIRQFVPCANGGQGEYVAMEGVIMEKWSQHEDGSNAVHYRSAAQLQQFAGLGETTGATYHASGSFTIREYTDVDREDYWLGTTREWSDRIQIVGGGIVAQMQLKVRETIDPAGGGWVSDVIAERIECR